jgi:hypothetical protein
MEGAHLARWHVEQVAGIAGGIGRAASELDGALDQGDRRARRTSPEKMQCEKGPAEAGANNRNSSHCPSNELFRDHETLSNEHNPAIAHPFETGPFLNMEGGLDFSGLADAFPDLS